MGHRQKPYCVLYRQIYLQASQIQLCITAPYYKTEFVEPEARSYIQVYTENQKHLLAKISKKKKWVLKLSLTRKLVMGPLQCWWDEASLQIQVNCYILQFFQSCKNPRPWDQPSQQWSDVVLASYLINTH